jgi:hypothetical protein
MRPETDLDFFGWNRRRGKKLADRIENDFKVENLRSQFATSSSYTHHSKSDNCSEWGFITRPRSNNSVWTTDIGFWFGIFPRDLLADDRTEMAQLET